MSRRMGQNWRRSDHGKRFSLFLSWIEQNFGDTRSFSTWREMKGVNSPVANDVFFILTGLPVAPATNEMTWFVRSNVILAIEQINGKHTTHKNTWFS